MAEVILSQISKVYPGGVKAVDGVDLTIRDTEFIVLVGPSGCGKSTTLRMVAGLEDISGGTIRIGDRVVNDVAPKDRDIAMVFQNYALYPHMDVYNNMAFGLKLRRKHAMWDNPVAAMVAPGRRAEARAERDEIDRRVRDAAEILGITNLLARRPRQLSGGQRQRVAVGRAIVRQPKAFLFDEPLSNLDAKLRVEMRAELKRLHRQVRTTTIYVTHDQEEAMTLGDRVVVMKDGRIHQCATPFETYERPVNRFVAGFVGTPPMNFLEGRLLPAGGGLTFDDGEQKLALCARHAAKLAAYADKSVVIGIRPEFLHPADGAASTTAADIAGHRLETGATEMLSHRLETGATATHGAYLQVNIGVVEPLGDRMDVMASTPRHPHLVARVDSRSPVREGTAARLRVDMDRVHFFEPGPDGRNISLD
ncbi:Trehalose import ATP-binding protein SugC [Phycisphaerae bacterium RAS1]|nr:Trehalose import ATP-binding protein SugC [Phycisphaerae bacterium RAS1]